MSLFVKLAGKRLPSQEIVFFRGLISALLCYVWLCQKRIPFWGNNRKLLVLRGGFGFGALCCFFYSVTHMPLADATVIQFINPVFTAFLSAFFLSERMDRIRVLALMLSFTGVVFIVRPAFLFGEATPNFSGFVVMLALFGAMFSSAAYICVRKLSVTEHPIVVIFYFSFMAVPASVPLLWPVAIWPIGREWLWLISVGISTHLGQVFMTKGIFLEGAGRATSVAYVQVVFASLWGFLFFQEQPSPLSILGILCVIIGTLLVAR